MSGSSTDPPFTALPPSPLLTYYVVDRILGGISERAFMQPYLGEEQEQAAKLGYSQSKVPYVPLKGQIVADTPGLLEVYQTHTVFSASKGADALMSVIVNSSFGGGEKRSVPAPTFQGETKGYEYSGAFGFPTSQFESVVGVALAFGDVVLQISFQGGTGVTPVTVARYVAEAVKVFSKACG